MADEPFGRQRKPVTVTLSGEPIDIDYYIRQLRAAIDNPHGDHTVRAAPHKFVIYPRAVND